MKLLVVLASLVCVVYSTGGRHDQDASTYSKYLAMALNELVTQDTAPDAEVVRVQTQVVAGINTFITLKINGKICEIDLFDQVWTKTHQVTRNTCGTNKRQLGLAGGWSDVTDLSDPMVQKAIGMVIDEVNNRVNSMYRMTESQIISVKEQVVAGMNYDIKLTVQQSSCMNDQAHQHLMASRCPVDTNSAMQPMMVHAKLWSRAWENFMQITSFAVTSM